MRALRPLGGALAAAALTLVLAACGDDKSDGKSNSNDAVASSKPAPGVAASPRPSTLSIYISAAQSGGSSASGQSVTDGATLALEQHDGQAAGYPVHLVVLDDADQQTGAVSPEIAASNARIAAADDTTIAYIGDQSSTASAASIPILNRGGILQVSPTVTYDGLTRAGVEANEPGRYYPTGRRTFARVVPADRLQSIAQAEWQKQVGCTSVVAVDDGSLYGKGLATEVAKQDKAQGMTATRQTVDLTTTEPSEAAAQVTGAGANCMFFGGSPTDNVITFWKFVYTNAPNMKLFGADALAQTGFTTAIGGAGASTLLTAAAVSPKLYNDAGLDFYESYQTRFGGTPEASGIFGYEAMLSILDTIDSLGDDGNDRSKVIAKYFSIKDRPSVLGTYSIDADGDTTLGRYGAYSVKEGILFFDHVIQPSAGEEDKNQGQAGS